MKTSKASPLVRNSIVATLMAGAALFLGACSTTPPQSTASAISEPSEKPVSFGQLHGMMLKLAAEPAMGSGVALATSPAEIDLSRALASNP